MFSSVIKLGIACLLGPAIAVLIQWTEKHTRYARLKYSVRQLLTGIIFGGLAILGTEWGIAINGAQVNCRDGAVLIAGLFFGGPSGIIAGLIGGIERWIAVAWGIGTYTRVACTVSTILAGFYAAALRRFLFDNRRPKWLMATVIGVVIEIFHLTMVFVTNMGDAAEATRIIRSVSAIQILANALSVATASIVLTLMNHEKIIDRGENVSLNDLIQRRMLYVFIVVFFITTIFTVNLQKGETLRQTESFLDSGLNNISNDIKEGNTQSVKNSDYFVGINGHILIFASEDHEPVHIPEEWSGQTTTIRTQLEGFEENVMFEINASGEEYFCKMIEVGGLDALAVISKNETFQLYYMGLLVNEFMEIMISAVLFGLIYLLIKRQVTDQIVTVNRSLHNITEGHLDERVDVHSSTEFNQLSGDINATVDTLRTYIGEAEKRMEAELELARNIQASALPGDGSIFGNRKEFEIYGMMDPAKEVGGDFYDFYLTEQTRLNFLVADVSGKGIPAAMFMMTAKTELRNLTLAGNTIGKTFTDANCVLCEHNDAGMFVTAWQGQLNLENGTLRYVNAGHNPPLICRKDGTFEYLRGKHGFILAGMENMTYHSSKIILQPGDVIFLYTDGVTEATDKDHRLYGEERLQNTLNSLKNLPVREICRGVQNDVNSFVGGAPQFDDITMVALRYQVPSQIRQEFRLDFAEAGIEDVEKTMVLFEKEMEEREYPTKAIRQISVAIDELMSNIVKYGYPENKGPISVSLREITGSNTLKIEFVDQAIPFDPTAVEEPDVTASAEERKIGGLGIMMVRKIMDGFDYRYEDGKNVVTLYKRM